VLIFVLHILILVANLIIAVADVNLVATWTSLDKMYVFTGFALFAAFMVVTTAREFGLSGFGVRHDGALDVKV
jgi:capsule polysaccharide export protein KpsC/LpsZ